MIFEKVDVDFDFMKLRKDVLTTYNSIIAEAAGTENEILAYRNQSITVSEKDSTDWADGIAGKTFVNNTRLDTSVSLSTQLTREQNEMLNERQYIHPLKQIQGTYLEEFVQSIKGAYRWRISILPPRTTLSIHVDGHDHMPSLQGGSAILTWRLHFPIKTSNRAFIVGWPDDFTSVEHSGEEITLQMANFKTPNSYLLDTSKIHCATNYSNEVRIHLIASLDKDEFLG
jgi:hypothetical protein